MNTITPTAITANTTVSDGPMLNAAPGLRVTSSFRKPPSSLTGGRSDRVATITTLVTTSVTSTITATASRTTILRRGLAVGLTDAIVPAGSGPLTVLLPV